MGRLLLGSVLTGALLGTTLEARAQEANKEPQLKQTSSTELSLEEIAKEVQKPVEEILKGVPITYLTPDNYDKEVYQESLSPAQKRPVIVFFYQTLEDDKVTPTKRLVVVFRELVIKYNGKIKFCAFDDSKFKDPRINISRIADKDGITTVPSLAMYSPFDLVKGETPEKNDGKVEQIDILRGGPKDGSWLLTWLDNVQNHWIPSNITNPDGAFVWRVSNSANYKKIAYSRR